MFEHSPLRFEDSSEPEEPEISVSAQQSGAIPKIGDSDLRGEWFGDYLLVGELAVGGMAEVFLAVKQGLAGFFKVVVIKRVLPQFSSNEEFVRMFVDEARLAARLEHPNIVRTYEFGEIDGQYFTVMEYLPGEDLSKIIARLSISRQKMPLHIAAGVASQLCAGLHFAHQLTDMSGLPLNLVHRDIAPGNILITYGGEVKIIDFGVAKTNDNDETVAGTIKGKIAYMAPEQILARAVDQRADVFSAGVVLWEMLTGRSLFMRNSEAATLYAIMEDPIPAPSRFRADVPRQLDVIVGRALARTPADRYQSASDMGVALDDFLVHQQRYDARVLADKVEELFGSTRAEAKRSIAQTRALATNISLVMKLRSDVREDLSAKLDGAEQDASDDAERSQRGLVIALVAIIAACVVAGVVYMRSTAPADQPVAAVRAAQGTIEVTSTPVGAAVFLRGEPTGLQTPATLRLSPAAGIAIRLELAGHEPATETLDVREGARIAKHFALTASTGRLAISGLPARAVVSVDGEEFVPGVVIPVAAGQHDVRVLVDDKVIARQSLETKTGLQTWKLVDGAFVRHE